MTDLDFTMYPVERTELILEDPIDIDHELIDYMWHSAKGVMQFAGSHSPMLFAYRPFALHIYDVTSMLEDIKGKNALSHMMHDLASSTEENYDALFFITEAWVTKASSEEEADRIVNEGLLNSVDRTEVLLMHAELRNGTQVIRSAEIRRGNNDTVVAITEDADNTYTTITGKFANLFPQGSC